MPQTCVIFNEQSGSAERLSHLRRRFENQSTFKFWPIREMDVQELVRRAVESGFERIVAAGGDGTILAVLNGLAPNFAAVEFGVLPLGTGNDLARSLGFTVDHLEEALNRCHQAPSRPMDIVRLEVGKRHADAHITPGWLLEGRDTVYFANAASGGFGGEVAADIDSTEKKRWGPFAYWMAAITNLAELHEHNLYLEMDDQRLELEAYGLSIANGRYVGGGFCISNNALLDDGLLNVTVIPVLPTLEMLSAGLNFTMKTQDPHARITNYTARRVSVRCDPPMAFSIDGEVIGRVDFCCEVQPRAIRVVAVNDSVFGGRAESADQTAESVERPSSGESAASSSRFQA